MCGSFRAPAPRRGRRQPAHLAAQQPEPLRAAVLLGALEQQLHPHARPEQRCPRRGALAQQLVEAELADRRHRRRERPHAGEQQAVGGPQLRVVAADERLRADALQRLFHRAAIAHPVVHDRHDPRPARAAS